MGRLQKRHIFAAIFAALFLLGYFFPGRLWSSSNPFFLPLWIQLLFWVLLLFTIPREGAEYLSRAGDSAGDLLFERWPAVAVQIAIFLGAALGGILLRSRHFLWGDSHMLTGIVTLYPEHPSRSIQSYFTLILYDGAQRLVRLFSDAGDAKTAYWGITGLSALFGGLYSVICYRLSKRFAGGGSRRLAALMVLLLSGAGMVFTHIEFYAPALCMAAWALYLYLTRKKSTSGFRRISYLIPALVAGVLYLPLVYILVLFIVFEIFAERHHLLIAGILSAAAIAAYWILGSIFELPLKQFFLPLSHPDYFLSWKRLLTLVNFFIFLSPAAILLFTPTRPVDRSRELGGMALCAAALILVLNLSFAGMDWNIAATLILPLMVLLAEKTAALSKKGAITVAMLCFLAFGSWLYLNVDEERGMAKGEAMLLKEWSPYFEEKSPQERLAQVYFFNMKKDERAPRIIKYAGWCLENEPYCENAYDYLIEIYGRRKNYERAAFIALKALEQGMVKTHYLKQLACAGGYMVLRENPRGSGEVAVYDPAFVAELKALLGSSVNIPPGRGRSILELYSITAFISDLCKTGDVAAAESIYAAGRRLYPHSGLIPLSFGSDLVRIDSTAKGRPLLRQAAALNGYTGNIYTTLAVSHYKDGNFVTAERYFNKAIETCPERLDYNYNYAYALATRGRTSEAISHMKDYIERAKYVEQRRRARDAIESFRK